MLSRVLSIEYVFPPSGHEASQADPAYTGGRRAQFIVSRVRLVPVATHVGFSAPSSADGADGGAVVWDTPRLSRGTTLLAPFVVEVTPRTPDCLVLRPRYEAAMRRWGASWGADTAGIGRLAGAPCLVPFLRVSEGLGICA